MTATDRDAVRAAHASSILRAAIAAADPAPAVTSAVRSMSDLDHTHHLHVLAIGKAADPMAAAALAALPRAPDSVLVIMPRTAGSSGAATTGRGDVLYAAHPVPDQSSLAAAARVDDMLRSAGKGDAVIVLLSGGASSLCAAPIAGLEIDEYAAAVRSLMHAGADIRELNTVRAHIDRLKGGGMARLVAPARAFGLVVSDVVDDALDVIASGPLTPCRTTRQDALRVIEKYGLQSTLPSAVLSSLRTAVVEPHAPFAGVSVDIVLDNRAAREGAAHAAARLGYDVRIIDVPITGPARDAGSGIARDALAHARRLRSSERPACVISGGETTVVVRGTGAGGRNQELVLAAAIELDGNPDVTVASIGTDGIDGPTDAAGAVADGSTIGRAHAAGFDAHAALRDNDSYTVLDAAGALIRTGATGTNVMDVQVVLIDPPAA